MMNVCRNCVVASVVGLAIGLTVQARVWTSASGNTIEAELVEQKMNDVVLRKTDGTKVAINRSKLSPQDNSYLQQLALGKVSKKASDAAGPVPQHIESLFGGELTNADKEDISAAALGGKAVGIYFSAHWCPPCRQFTPKLVKAYKDLAKDGEAFEIVFVSSDRSKDDMYGYMKDMDMPWLALPFKSNKKSSLGSKFEVRGIPKFVLLDKNGKVVTQDARGAVSANGSKGIKDLL